MEWWVKSTCYSRVRECSPSEEASRIQAADSSQFLIGQIQNGGSCTCVSDAETLFLKLKTGNPKDAFRKYYFAFLGTCVKWRNYPSESSFTAVRFFTRSSNATRRKSRGNKTVCTHLWGHFIVVDVRLMLA